MYRVSITDEKAALEFECEAPHPLEALRKAIREACRQGWQPSLSGFDTCVKPVSKPENHPRRPWWWPFNTGDAAR